MFQKFIDNDDPVVIFEMQPSILVTLPAMHMVWTSSFLLYIDFIILNDCVSLVFLFGYFYVKHFIKYVKFWKKYIHKMVYDPKTREFILSRNSYFGSQRQERIPVEAMLYTRDKLLRKENINFINV